MLLATPALGLSCAAAAVETLMAVHIALPSSLYVAHLQI